jgi:hypothetical protein
MVLFDPQDALSIKEGNVAGRQGGGREIMKTMRVIMRDNECKSKTKKEMDLRNVK